MLASISGECITRVNVLENYAESMDANFFQENYLTLLHSEFLDRKDVSHFRKMGIDLTATQ